MKRILLKILSISVLFFIFVLSVQSKKNDQDKKSEKNSPARKISNTEDEVEYDSGNTQNENLFLDNFACGRLLKKIYKDDTINDNNSTKPNCGNSFGVDPKSLYQSCKNLKGYFSNIEKKFSFKKKLFGQRKIKSECSRISQNTSGNLSVFSFHSNYCMSDTDIKNQDFEPSLLEVEAMDKPYAEISKITIGCFLNCGGSTEIYSPYSPPMEFQFNPNNNDKSCAMGSVRTCLTRNLLFGRSNWAGSEIDPDLAVKEERNTNETIVNFSENFFNSSNANRTRKNCNYQYTMNKDLCTSVLNEISRNNLDGAISAISKGVSVVPDAISKNKSVILMEGDNISDADNFLKEKIKQSLSKSGFCKTYEMVKDPIPSNMKILCFNNPNWDKALKFLEKPKLEVKEEYKNAKKQNDKDKPNLKKNLEEESIDDLCDIYPYRTVGVDVVGLEDDRMGSQAVTQFNEKFLETVKNEARADNFYSTCYLVSNEFYTKTKNECIKNFSSLKAKYEMVNLYLDEIKVFFQQNKNPIQGILKNKENLDMDGCTAYSFKEDNLYSSLLNSDFKGENFNELNSIFSPPSAPDEFSDSDRDGSIFHNFFETANNYSDKPIYCLKKGDKVDLVKHLKYLINLSETVSFKYSSFINDAKPTSNSSNALFDDTLGAKLESREIDKDILRKYFPFKKKELPLSSCEAIQYFKNTCEHLFGIEEIERQAIKPKRMSVSR